MKAIRYRVTGRVQGVGFRVYLRRVAEFLALSGHVRNDGDGSVTGRAQGSDEAIERLIAALHRGPPTAIVIHLSVDLDKPDDATEFTIRG